MGDTKRSMKYEVITCIDPNTCRQVCNNSNIKVIIANTSELKWHDQSLN